MTTRTNPFEALERTFERMSRQFDEAASAWESGDPLDFRSNESMAMDLVERDDEYVVTVEVPGFDREDITVKKVEDTLQIEAEHEESEEEAEENYIRRERRMETTSRAITLPEDVDPEEITAKARNGVLTVRIPRIDVESEAETIEIESE